MKKLFYTLLLLTGLSTGVAPAATAASPVYQFAAVCKVSVLGFPAWYNGLTCDAGNKNPQPKKLNDIWIIVLNVLQDVIVATGYITVGLIIWGGIKYTKSQGSADQVKSAKDTILQAVVGLGIVLASVAIVNFVLGNIK